MLPIPKDENFEIKGKDTWEEDSLNANWNEADSDAEIVASNPAAFDYSEYDDNQEAEKDESIAASQQIRMLITPPVSPYSTQEEIKKWIDELAEMEPSIDVENALIEAKGWLMQEPHPNAA